MRNIQISMVQTVLGLEHAAGVDQQLLQSAAAPLTINCVALEKAI
jgi:hypothetical protein